MRVRRPRRSAAVKLRDNVLAIVAHDLRTPLATITMAADQLRDSENNSQKLHFLDMIMNAARHADGLVRDLVDAERIVAGGLRVECRNESIAQLLESVTEGFEPQAGRLGVRLKCDSRAVCNVVLCWVSMRTSCRMSSSVSGRRLTAAGRGRARPCDRQGNR